MVLKEFFCEQIVSPTTKGGFLKLSPGVLRVDTKTGQLAEIGKLSRAKLSSRSRKVTRLKAVIPGLIDCHTHTVFAGHRAEEWGRRLAGESYEDISRGGGGIKTSVKATRKDSESNLLKIAIERAHQFLEFGVCCFETKTGYGLDWKTEKKLLSVAQKLNKKIPQEVVSTFLAAHALPSEQESTQTYVDQIISKMLPQVEGLAEFQDVFVERGYFDKESAIRLLEAGKKYGLKPKVHAHEFGRTGGVDVAVRVGAVSADHLQFVSAIDVAEMKRKNVVAVLLPGTSFFLGAKDFAPARKLWDAGLKIALASDFNPGTNPSLNFPLVGTFAAVHQGLNLEEVLTAQTYHAALALDRQDQGVLQKGFRANFVELDALRFEEMYYHYGQSLVSSVYIAGKKVL